MVAKKDETVETKSTLNIDELKAQLKAELRDEIETEIVAKQKEKVEKAAKEEAKIEKAIAKEVQTMKDRLAAEPKKTIFIPENPLNPNEVVPVGVNGVIYAIPVGQEFEVPQSIYDTWKYSYEKTREANKKMDKVLKKEIKIL